MTTEPNNNFSQQGQDAIMAERAMDRFSSVSVAPREVSAPSFPTNDSDVFDRFADSTSSFSNSSSFSDSMFAAHSKVYADYNRRFLDENANSLSTASEKDYFAGGSLDGTLQIGVLSPLIGFGPAASVGASARVTTSWDIQLQFQAAYGGGIGSFVGFGISPEVGTTTATDMSKLLVFEHYYELQLNAGLGPSIGASLEGNQDSMSLSWSTLKLKSPYRPKLGAGYGLAGAFMSGASATLTIPVGSVYVDMTNIVDEAISGLREFAENPVDPEAWGGQKWEY